MLCVMALHDSLLPLLVYKQTGKILNNFGAKILTFYIFIGGVADAFYNCTCGPQSNPIKLLLYEEHVLVVSNQIYYWMYKCTTCHHYTSMIKNGLIKLIKTRKSIYKMWKGLA